MRSLHILVALTLFSNASAQQPCAARLGGNWFINCKSLISYQDKPVVTFSDWSDPVATVNLDVYSTTHILEAQVKAGKLVKGDPKRFEVKATDTEFSVVDKRTDRVICVLKEVPSTTPKAACQVNVWLDLFVAGEGYFHSDPESCNEPVMQYMKDGIFSGNLTAISLH